MGFGGEHEGFSELGHLFGREGTQGVFPQFLPDSANVLQLGLFGYALEEVISEDVHIVQESGGLIN